MDIYCYSLYFYACLKDACFFFLMKGSRHLEIRVKADKRRPGSSEDEQRDGISREAES